MKFTLFRRDKNNQLHISTRTFEQVIARMTAKDQQAIYEVCPNVEMRRGSAGTPVPRVLNNMRGSVRGAQTSASAIWHAANKPGTTVIVTRHGCRHAALCCISTIYGSVTTILPVYSADSLSSQPARIVYSLLSDFGLALDEPSVHNFPDHANVNGNDALALASACTLDDDIASATILYHCAAGSAHRQDFFWYCHILRIAIMLFKNPIQKYSNSLT